MSVVALNPPETQPFLTEKPASGNVIFGDAHSVASQMSATASISRADMATVILKLTEEICAAKGVSKYPPTKQTVAESLGWNADATATTLPKAILPTKEELD